MTPERWQQIDRIFHAALERRPDERAAFVDENCVHDEGLCREIHNLLAAHEQSKSFIETPAADLAASLIAEDDAGLVAGQGIGPYTIVKLLGAGGMGQVYLATDTRLGRQVALKILPKQFTIDPERVRRFEKEARAASALNHPNIVTIHEVGNFNDTRFIVTEFVDGHTLRQLIHEKPLTLHETLNVTIQVASALKAAHAAGIVHRDIKPENIMLRADGYVKILDFGLAKLTESSIAAPQLEGSTLLRSNPGLVMGTVQYMSPEQARGGKTDARTDIWSLGVVLYELLARQAPFSGETPSHVMVSVMEHEPPALTESIGVPSELNEIVLKALRKKKKERYQTTDELIRDLNEIKQEMQIESRLKQWSGAGQKFERAQRRSDKTGSPKRHTTARTVGVGIAQPTSSAEYVVNEIKRHKTGAAIMCLTALAIAIVAIAYVYHFPSAASGEAIDSVAVLPFINVNNDPNSEYLSDGLSEIVIDSLSHLPNLKRVSSFSSVLHFKGKQVDPQAVGHELNVRGVLEGRLTQRGDDLFITTELIDVKDGRRLWGSQYTGKLTDLSKLQGEIAGGVSDKLRLKLSDEQKARLTTPRTQNPEAYQLYLQGRYFWRKGNGARPEDLSKSAEFFLKAIEKDPNFALAYAGRADYYAKMANFGLMAPNEAWPKSEEAAVKALAIDETLSEAHNSLGEVKIWYDWDWPGAELEFKRAIELNPEFPDALSYYNRVLEMTGRIDEAIAELKNRANPNPLNPPNGRLAHLLYELGRYDEAIEEYRKGPEKDPNLIIAGGLVPAVIYLKQAKYEDALAEVLKARSRIKDPRALAHVGYIYAAAGKQDEAVKILREVKGLTSEHYNLDTPIAAIYTALGEKDRAFAWLEKAYADHDHGVADLKVNPQFDTLRSDARFTDLLRRVRLAS
jgi:serine/threonine-protein kinase